MGNYYSIKKYNEIQQELIGLSELAIKLIGKKLVLVISIIPNIEYR